MLLKHKLPKFNTKKDTEKAIFIIKILTDKQDISLLNLASKILSKGTTSITKKK